MLSASGLDRLGKSWKVDLTASFFSPVTSSMHFLPRLPQTFGITNPGANPPTTTLVNGILVPDSNYQMDDNAVAQNYWCEVNDELEALIYNMQKQYDLLSAEMSRAEQFFNSYIEGNSLNAAFYRWDSDLWMPLSTSFINSMIAHYDMLALYEPPS